MERLKNMEALLQEITIDGVVKYHIANFFFDFAEKMGDKHGSLHGAGKNDCRVC